MHKGCTKRPDVSRRNLTQTWTDPGLLRQNTQRDRQKTEEEDILLPYVEKDLWFLVANNLSSVNKMNWGSQVKERNTCNFLMAIKREQWAELLRAQVSYSGWNSC